MLVTTHPLGDHEDRRLAAETTPSGSCLRRGRLRRLDDGLGCVWIYAHRTFHVLESHPTTCLADVTRQTGCDRRDGGVVQAPPKAQLPPQACLPQDYPFSDKLALVSTIHQTPVASSFATEEVGNRRDILSRQTHVGSGPPARQSDPPSFNFDAREAPNCFPRRLAVPNASTATLSPSGMPGSNARSVRHAGGSAYGV